MKANLERRVLCYLDGQITVEQVFAGLKGVAIQEAGAIAERYAQRASYLADYLDTRGGAGCGDHGHEAACKSAQRRVKRVRKALGFLIP